MGEPELFPEEADFLDSLGISAIRSDEYYGKPLATAVQQYLERRKQACSADDILKALEQGGFDFRALSWGETERLRILAISLAKNTVTFHKLPNGTFGVRGWYDEATLNRTPIKRRSKGKRKPVVATGAVTKTRKAKKIQTEGGHNQATESKTLPVTASRVN